METESPNYKKQGLLARAHSQIKAFPKKLKSGIVENFLNIKKIAQDDPRRVIHSIKVGLCISLVSLIYYFQPLYDNFGVTAMWAVMTVVVVFEFYVGATLGKGLNRGVATLLAGALGVGAHHLASLSGHIGQPIILGFFVFVQAAVSTFLRFFPKIKARYDYGLLIFILTFSLISVSGFRYDEILEMAHKRLSTIIIGGAACIIISIIVCPAWAGEDLHNLISQHMEKVGNFLEGFGDEYFGTDENNDKSFLQGYKSVLNSKNIEESLGNFARWEPGHGRFKFRHPWNQYLKIGALTRQCAYRIEALNGYLDSDHGLEKPEIRSEIRDAITTTSVESGRALKELAFSMKKMTKPNVSAEFHVENLKSAAETLNSLLSSGLWKDGDVVEAVAVATVASLLIDIVNCTEEIAESVEELAGMAGFVEAPVSPVKKIPGSLKSPEKVDCCSHVVIEVAGGNETRKFENSLELKDGGAKKMEV